MTGSSNDSTSLTLLERARSNETGAWEQLVQLYGPLVERWCLRSGLTHADAADVFQETFRTVSTSLGGFSPRRPAGSFRSWLRTIVRTRIVDHRRRQYRQLPAEGGTDAQRRLADVADPLGEASGEDRAEEQVLLVHRAMQMIQHEFTEQNWKAFQDVSLGGRSVSDLASEMHVHPQAIRQANYRIRRRLRMILEDLDEGG